MGWLNGFATIICILDYVGVWRLDCRIKPHGWRLANHPVKRTQTVQFACRARHTFEHFDRQ